MINFFKGRGPTSAVFVDEIGEAPDVAESDGVSETRQHELSGAAPATPIRRRTTGSTLFTTTVVSPLFNRTSYNQPYTVVI